MAAPVPTARGTPAGIILKEGLATVVTFARFPTVAFKEKMVTPPGVDGGEPVDLNTMFNVNWDQKAPRRRKTLTPGNTKVAYDPNAYNTIVNSMINIPDTITVWFVDGSSLAFFGYLQKFEPGEIQEGQMPEATVSFVPTNMDSSGAEQGPVLTSISGT